MEGCKPSFVAPLNLFIAWCPSLQLNCVTGVESDTWGRKQALAAQFDADVDDFLRENEELKDKAWRRMSRHVNCYMYIIDLLCKLARAVLLRPVMKAHRPIGVKAFTVWVAISTLRNSFLTGRDMVLVWTTSLYEVVFELASRDD